jgi:serine/threonine protein kinase
MGCSSSSASASHGHTHGFHAKYKLGKKLGEGNFGQVRVATQRSEQKAFAVKILDFRSSDKFIDVRRLEDAHSEVDAMQIVGGHLHCVELFEAFFEDSLSYMVMEKCMNSLLDKLDEMAYASEDYVVRLFREMLCAIDHVHKNNLVHCDIKPDNFLLGGDDGTTVKLTDFGLVRKMPAKGYLTSMCGTAPYMSPEIVGRKRYGFKTDVWSMGVTAYLLLYGDFPYLPEKVSSEAMKQQILRGKPAPSFLPASRDAPAPSERARAFVKSLMTRDQADRYTACEALKMSYMSPSCPPPLDKADNLIPTLREARKRTRKLEKSIAVPTSSREGLDELLSSLQAKTELLARSKPELLTRSKPEILTRSKPDILTRANRTAPALGRGHADPSEEHTGSESESSSLPDRDGHNNSSGSCARCSACKSDPIRDQGKEGTASTCSSDNIVFNGMDSDVDSSNFHVSSGTSDCTPIDPQGIILPSLPYCLTLTGDAPSAH